MGVELAVGMPVMVMLGVFFLPMVMVMAGMLGIFFLAMIVVVVRLWALAFAL